MREFLAWCRNDLPSELSNVWHYGSVPMKEAFIAGGMFFSAGALAGAVTVVWLLR